MTRWIMLVACVAQDPLDTCAQGEPIALPGAVLGAADACGTWSMAVGDRVAVEVPVTAAEVPCGWSADGAVGTPYDPIYTNFDGDSAKWTFDVHAVEAGDGALRVDCDDGTGWVGFFVVE
jgi:hypothetical protein